MRDYEFYYTEDGSIGLYSYADNDVYHSKFGALSEAWQKFVLPLNLENRLRDTNEIKVLDVCYGVGYNTKALMNAILNYNNKNKNKINILKKINYDLKTFLNKSKKEKSTVLNNIETINNDNANQKNKELSLYNDKIHNDNSDTFSYYNKNACNLKIDCLEIDDELVKISPFLKTILTPQEILSKFTPQKLKRNKLYKIFKLIFVFMFSFMLPRNKKNIKDLLNLKYGKNYIDINEEYKINNIINYIIADKINEANHDEYVKAMKKIFKDRKISSYLDKSKLSYIKNKPYHLTNYIYDNILKAFSHNIYYQYISLRYGLGDYIDIKSKFNLNFYLQDARDSVQTLTESYDYIFLDAFTFSKAPELWSQEFINKLYDLLSPNGYLVTYSNSALVRNTLLLNKFYVGKIYDKVNDKFVGTIASKNKELIDFPLDNNELGLCSTKAGIPYHDPTLKATKETILKLREKEFKESALLSSSQYMRQRMNKENTNEE